MTWASIFFAIARAATVAAPANRRRWCNPRWRGAIVAAAVSLLGSSGAQAECSEVSESPNQTAISELYLKSDRPNLADAIRFRLPQGSDVRGYRPHPVPHPDNIDWPSYGKSEKTRNGCEYIAFAIRTPYHSFQLDMPGIGDGDNNFYKPTFRLNALIAAANLMPLSNQEPHVQQTIILDLSARPPMDLGKSFTVNGSTTFRMRRLFLFRDLRHKSIGLSAIGCDPDFRSHGKPGGELTYPCLVNSTASKSRILLQMSISIACELDSPTCRSYLLSQLEIVDQWLAAAFVDN